jgi:hypothetical protein
VDTIDQGVLEARGEALVVLGVEGALIESGEGSVLVEVYIVLGKVVVIFHGEVIKFVRGCSCGIGLSECGFQGFFEVVPMCSDWQ